MSDGREMTMAMEMVGVVGGVCDGSSVGGVRKIVNARFLRKTKNRREKGRSNDKFTIGQRHNFYLFHKQDLLLRIRVTPRVIK